MASQNYRMSKSMNRDGNQIIQIKDGNRYEVTGQTTDDTKTTLKTVALSVGDAVYIEVTALAIEDDSGDIGDVGAYREVALLYRPASGTVTLASTNMDVHSEIVIGDGGNWELAIEADDTAKTADINVTGEADTTLDWYLDVRVKKNSALTG